MRILIINTLYTPFKVGGAERSVALLAESLVRAGEEVSIITLHTGQDSTVNEENGVRVYRVPLYNNYWPFNLKEKPGLVKRQLWHMADMFNRKAARHIGEILDKEKPDVVHTNNLLGFSVSAWKEVKKRKIRLVHTMRDFYLICPRCTIFRNGVVCEKRCAECKVMTVNRKPASHMVDKVVSISEFVLKEHKRHGYFKDVPSAVVYNIAGLGIDHHPVERDPADKTLIFGFIGRVEPEKGIEVVLKASAMLKNNNWRLKIAGSGLDAYVNDLRQRYPDPRIEWLGFASAAEFYSSIDVSIISSIWAEPLGRTLIETFAAGKSSICARSGGLTEIAPLGRVVETYPPLDEHALAAIMDRALADVDRWRGGGFIDPNALEKFSESAITTSYQQIYREK